MSRNTDQTSILLPADVEDILDTYSDIMDSYQVIQDRNSIYASYKRTKGKLDVLFPLKEYPIHGVTGIHAIEKYDQSGHITRYHYQWKRMVPKQGIKFSHISAWENEPHTDGCTSVEYVVKTEPHHHHHIPGARKQRQENYNTRPLEAAFAFVAHYIRNQKEYKPKIH